MTDVCGCGFLKFNYSNKLICIGIFQSKIKDNEAIGDNVIYFDFFSSEMKSPDLIFKSTEIVDIPEVHRFWKKQQAVLKKDCF